MLSNEARWLGERLSEYSEAELSPLINLGSSTTVFRERGQPFISRLIVKPLEQRGIRVVHTDLEDGDGVDIAGDIFDPKVYRELRSHKPKAILCANILEHVENPGALAQACVDMVEERGLILATVPYDFPYHLAPIDTRFRPTPEEMATLFKGCTIRHAEIVQSETFGQQILCSPLTLAKHLVRMTLPWPTVEHWKAAMHRNLWLFRHYRTSCVVLEKQ